MKTIAVTLIVTIGVVTFFSTLFMRVNESEANNNLYETCGKQGVTCNINRTVSE